MYIIATTFNKKLDWFIQEALIKYSKNEYTEKQVIQSLVDGESYDEDGEPLFPDADMTKETKYDVVETMVSISGKSEDDIWVIYDEVYDAFYANHKDIEMDQPAN